MAKDHTLVAGTGGFAATLKILEEADQKSCHIRSTGVLPDFKYADIKINGGLALSEDTSSSMALNKTILENIKSKSCQRYSR